MPEVSQPEWLSGLLRLLQRVWAFWSRDPQGIRDLVFTVGVVLGIPFLVWREWLHNRQAKAALSQAEAAQDRRKAQVDADRERRITDNFTRAVEQLGSDKLESRLGAIYALERIARESPVDHWPIMETLTAYVRERAPWPPKQAAKGAHEGAAEGEQARAAEGMGEQPQGRLKPATDIQAILTVISRRRRNHESKEQLLDLSRIDARGAFLPDAHLEAAYLSGAHLEEANLEGANLEGANLRGAHLVDANLEGANLEGANLEGANLEGAFLSGAHLVEATLSGAHLRGAHLEGANLRGAHLERASLSDADLAQGQFDIALSDEDTKLPPHIERLPRMGRGGPYDSGRMRAESGGARSRTRNDVSDWPIQ